MDEQLYQKLDENISEIKLTMKQIQQDTAEQKVTAAVQTEQLAEHMRRSLANEEAISKIAEEVKPIQEHVAIVNFMGKSITWVIGSGGLIAFLSRFFSD